MLTGPRRSTLHYGAHTDCAEDFNIPARVEGRPRHGPPFGGQVTHVFRDLLQFIRRPRTRGEGVLFFGEI